MRDIYMILFVFLVGSAVIIQASVVVDKSIVKEEKRVPCPDFCQDSLTKEICSLFCDPHLPKKDDEHCYVVCDRAGPTTPEDPEDPEEIFPDRQNKEINKYQQPTNPENPEGPETGFPDSQNKAIHKYDSLEREEKDEEEGPLKVINMLSKYAKKVYKFVSDWD